MILAAGPGGVPAPRGPPAAVPRTLPGPVECPLGSQVGREGDMTFFDLVLQTQGSLHPEGEPDRFISEYAGFILGEGEDGTARRVDKVLAYRIHADLAARSGEAPLRRL